ncbi:hypothetical protein [Pseudomonas fragi]|uniref:hypothetical protein n=1 Tax=Pseudomonas fragi TaxID=296 RepID=UPI001F0A764A|nr:hypothetical protein [Pseudomonas fragi]
MRKRYWHLTGQERFYRSPAQGSRPTLLTLSFIREALVFRSGDDGRALTCGLHLLFFKLTLQLNSLATLLGFAHTGLILTVYHSARRVSGCSAAVIADRSDLRRLTLGGWILHTARLCGGDRVITNAVPGYRFITVF